MDVYNIHACVWLFCGAYWCGVQFAGCNLRRAGCEMLSLILELQTGQLGFCFAQVVTIHCKKCLSHVLLRYTAPTNPHSKPCTPQTTPRSLQTTRCKIGEKVGSGILACYFLHKHVPVIAANSRCGTFTKEINHASTRSQYFIETFYCKDCL